MSHDASTSSVIFLIRKESCDVSTLLFCDNLNMYYFFSSVVRDVVVDHWFKHPPI